MSRFADRIRPRVQTELDASRDADTRDDAGLAFRHLQRAHVLGQAVTVEHVRVHVRMFLWAIRHRKAGEALGQCWRIAAAALKTGFGWVPQGNTGGTDVPGWRRMPIPPDLQRILDAARR